MYDLCDLLLRLFSLVFLSGGLVKTAVLGGLYGISLWYLSKLTLNFSVIIFLVSFINQNSHPYDTYAILLLLQMRNYIDKSFLQPSIKCVLALVCT